MPKDIIIETQKLISKRLEDIDCKHVAEKGGYSSKQMNRIFMAQMDMNVGEYIHSKKMAQAVMDLRYTELPIIEIAQKNGFGSQESFTRAFKKAFHVTPSRFRKDHIWENNEVKQGLIEIVEETSHEMARSREVELPQAKVSFMSKPKTLWYSIGRNIKGLFPHNFYVECKKAQLYEKLGGRR